MERAPLGVAVVGAGYWGPNLVRNLSLPKIGRCAASSSATRDRLERVLRLYPAIAGDVDIEVALADPASTLSHSPRRRGRITSSASRAIDAR